ncbi:aminoacylase-1-like [Battus philenor]|uniref:aminoacylase-1-like n=1 Tax=Battus philenor TaxID=42288 RepID=UPI0035D02B1D
MCANVLLCLFLIFKLVITFPLPKEYCIEQYVNSSAVKLLQEYIQIDTSNEENIEKAVNFWKREAVAMGLQFAIHRPANKPICIITWTGINPTLPSIILNSHMDVVSAAKQPWTYPPFSGYIDENGDLYGRGTQDTKALSINYLEAIRKLKESNIKLQRTIHMLLMPDEETGGFNGMISFLETDEFHDLNPGFFLDEGLTSSDETLYVTYQDKRPWQLNVTIYGEGGHGSSMPDETAMDKMQRLFDITTQFKQRQKQIMLSRDPLDYGSYTSLNINMINGGVAPNIIPSYLNVVIDMRLAMSIQVSEAEAMIETWLEQLGNGTQLSYIRKIEASQGTILDDNFYWNSFSNALKEMGLQCLPIVCPATSDMIYVRNKGYPAIGFAYRPHTEPRIHGSDEYINVVTFVQAIEVYVNILKNVGNLL